MSKRKYTKFGETPKAYECASKRCDWQGSSNEWVKIPSIEFDGMTDSSCPKCGCIEFYGLVNEPITK